MPRLDFSVTDPGAIRTPDTSLRVDYQYWFTNDGGASWTLGKDWTGLSASGGSSFVYLRNADLPGLEQARASTVNLIRIRVKDAVDRLSTKDFGFSMNFVPVPLVLANCTIATQLSGSTLQGHSLGAAYQSLSLPMLTGDINWPANVNDPHSMTALFAGANAASQITSLHQHRGTTGAPYWYNNFSTWSCYAGIGTACADAQGGKLNCTTGLCASDGWDCDRSTCGYNLSDVSTHSMTFMLGSTPGSTFSIPASVTPQTFRVSADNPRLLINGSTFLWPTDTSGTNYTHHTVTRYEATKASYTQPPGEPKDWSFYIANVTYDVQLSSFQVDVPPVTVTAYDPAHPADTPEVRALGTCAQTLRYITTPTGISVTFY